MLDESLRKFLSSEFGQKIILTAKLHGQDKFKYGKKEYEIKKLLGQIDALKQTKP